jgi:hypothetical protein
MGRRTGFGAAAEAAVAAASTDRSGRRRLGRPSPPQGSGAHRRGCVFDRPHTVAVEPDPIGRLARCPAAEGATQSRAAPLTGGYLRLGRRYGAEERASQATGPARVRVRNASRPEAPAPASDTSSRPAPGESCGARAGMDSPWRGARGTATSVHAARGRRRASVDAERIRAVRGSVAEAGRALAAAPRVQAGVEGGRAV